MSAGVPVLEPRQMAIGLQRRIEAKAGLLGVFVVQLHGKAGLGVAQPGQLMGGNRQERL